MIESFVFRTQLRQLGITDRYYGEMKTLLSEPAYTFAFVDINGVTNYLHSLKRKVWPVKECLELSKYLEEKSISGLKVRDKSLMQEVLHGYLKQNGSPLSEDEADRLMLIKLKKENLSKKDVYGELTEEEIAKIPSDVKKCLAHNIEMIGKLR